MKRVSSFGLVLLLLLASCAAVQKHAEETNPTTTESAPLVGVDEEVVREIREMSFAALMAEVASHGCRVVHVWESTVQWVRVAEYSCEGLSLVQILGWTEEGVWLRSELHTTTYQRGQPLVQRE